MQKLFTWLNRGSCTRDTWFASRLAAAIAVPVCLVVLSAASLCACSVPVFRYALERWPPESYTVVVFHLGPLSADDQELVSEMKKEIAAPDTPANAHVETADVSGELTEDLSALYKGLDAKALPTIVLWRSWREPCETVWVGALSRENVAALLRSPLRRETASQILADKVAVWVLVECGDQEADGQAASVLSSTLKKAETEVKDRMAALEAELSADGQAERHVENEEPVPSLPFRFSLVRLSRSDARERVLRAMLLSVESDLREYEGQPMAFPVFGRGRALYALVGKGIREDNICEACAFLAGPCACQVKAMNPGIDLLISANWDEAIGPPAMSYHEAPVSLTGVSAAPPTAEQIEETTQIDETTQEPVRPPIPSDHQEGTSVLVKAVEPFLLGVVLVAAVSFVILARRPRRQDR